VSVCAYGDSGCVCVCVCVRVIVKRKDLRVGEVASRPDIPFKQFEFHTTQEVGGDDVKDNRHTSMLHVFLSLNFYTNKRKYRKCILITNIKAQ